MHLLQRLMRPLEQARQPNPTGSWLRSHSSYLLVGLSVVALTSALGQRFYNAPRLDAGKAAPQTIYAPESVTVEDAKATEEKRKTARKDAISVLMIDPTVNQQIYQTLKRQLDEGTELRQLTGPFPFVKTAILSSSVQLSLRRIEESDWQKVLSIVSMAQNRPFSGPAAGRSPANAQASKVDVSSLSPDQRRAVTELQAYRQEVDTRTYDDLVQTISQARFNYSNAVSSLPQPASPETKPVYDATLLDLLDSDWQKIKAISLRVVERMLTQGIAAGLPESILQEAIRLHLQDLSPPAQPIATRLLLRALQPNLARDEAQTKLLAERAAQEIEPVMVTIRRNEVIVNAGETITTADFALLDRFGLSRRGTDWVGLMAFGTLVSGGVAVYWYVERRSATKMRQRDRLLILLLCLSTPLLVFLRVPSTNLPAVGVLVSTFYSSPLGLAVVGLMSVLLPIGVSVNWSQLLSSAVGGLLCGGVAGRLRSREELALLGAAVGVLQGSLYLLLNVVSGGTVWYALLGTAAIHGLLGLAWSIVAIGISPYLEQVFDLVTTIRLVELANPNRPLLKRLAAEAPGTFQHTLFVATLAEAAARSLGCNVELVRTGTLYHDIGKMHDPLGFIENQMGGPNKHDLINDPWKSAEIIKKHVTEGLVMARRSRLPKAVQAFIPEHQGTMLIAYFYHQAQQRLSRAEMPTLSGYRDAAEDSTVKESDFRYDGPAPQTRETGIVMLADSCEAALRSLKDASYDEALSMINKILRARWQDNQLTDSGLTREDLAKIATVFVEVWQQFNHQRIAYPKLAVTPPPSVVKS